MQEENYKLRVKIASPVALKRADKVFVKLFGQGTPQLLKIDHLKAEAGGGAVDEYVAALCDFVRGVLIKDQAPGTGVRGALTDWTEAYKRSLQVLSATPRPLATLLSGLMRFALNDFNDWRITTNYPLLDCGLETLGPLTENSPSILLALQLDFQHTKTVCPVDSGVDQVLAFNHRMRGLDRWSINDEANAVHLASSDPLGALDRAKARAVWAVAALRLGAHSSAEKALHQLTNNDCFGAWAETQLSELHQ